MRNKHGNPSLCQGEMCHTRVIATPIYRFWRFGIRQESEDGSSAEKFKIIFVDSLINFFHIRGHLKPILFANSVIESRFTASVYT